MCANHIHRKPKVSYARSIRVGLVGPKLRPRGVSDGQLVIIPAPLFAYGMMGTQKGKWSVPIGHGTSLILAPIYRSEERGKLRGNPRRFR